MAAKVITICSQKGGIGKTFATTEISAELQRRCYRTCAVDGDWMCALTSRQFPDGFPLEIDANSSGRVLTPGTAHVNRIYGEEPFEPLRLHDGRGLMGATEELNDINNRNSDCIYDFRTRFAELRAQFDYILIDSSPVWSNLLMANHLVADYLLIPTLLEKRPASVQKTSAHAEKIKERYNPNLKLLGIVVTQATVANYKKEVLGGRYASVDTENLKMLLEILEENGFGPEHLLAIIPYVQTKVREAIELNYTMKEYAPESPLVARYEALVDTIIARTGD
ncbi:Chromosome-partitioning ATPase Soj [Sodalis praecaptivus]